MTVFQLNTGQMQELKQYMLCDRYAQQDEAPSWGALADADEIISDEEAYEEYGGTDFSEEDFSCSSFK